VQPKLDKGLAAKIEIDAAASLPGDEKRKPKQRAGRRTQAIREQIASNRKN
jgi:hypothetical protein